LDLGENKLTEKSFALLIDFVMAQGSLQWLRIGTFNFSNFRKRLSWEQAGEPVEFPEQICTCVSGESQSPI
jgi:hypothetical protein